MRHNVDMFDHAIRHQQAMLKIKILPVPRRTLNDLFDQGCVFRMNPLENKFRGRFRRSVILEDSKSFLGPDELAGGRLPTEAPDMTEPLRFRQIRLALLELLFLYLQGLGSQSPIHYGRQQS